MGEWYETVWSLDGCCQQVNATAPVAVTLLHMTRLAVAVVWAGGSPMDQPATDPPCHSGLLFGIEVEEKHREGGGEHRGLCDRFKIVTVTAAVL